LEDSETHQLLVYAPEINFMGKNINKYHKENCRNSITC